ncbi:MAG: biotin transporter BioY [Gemmatimonadota bacterium]|nr:biotin transporter BioY [Gemmatimonadota bacterium]
MISHTISPPRARDRRIAFAGAVGFAAAVALASHAAIPVPGTPVPITLQPLVVVLAGMWLGPRVGAISMLLYLAAGVVGLPVFAPMGPPGVARLLGPTGGYLWAYPVAAWAVGMLCRRASSYAARALAAAAGIAVLYVGGVSQLTLLTGDASTALRLGALPFAALDLCKALLAAALAPGAGTRGPD